MIRFSRALITLALALSAPAFAEDAAPAPAVKPKLSVMPFAALTGDVPPRAGTKAVGMLTTEFKSADSFTLVEPKKEKAAGGAEDSLEKARKEVADAKDLRSKKKFRLAEEALQRAVTAYKTAAGSLPEIGEVVDAYALLSAVQFNTGRDDEGQKSIVQALALAPDRELPLAQTSALFGRLVTDTRKALKEGAKGALMVESSPSNAPVLVDGLALGATPLSVKDVPPGLHFWKVTLPSGEVVGGVVDVAAGKQAAAKATSASKDPESRVLSSLSQNRVDADLVTAAKEHAKAAEADLVVFGALSREGKGLVLDAFLFAASSGEVRRMGRASFDTELLSAGMEFYNLAGDLAKNTDKVGESVRVPASVSLTLVTGGVSKVAEAKYGVVPGSTGLDEGTTTGEPPKDDGPRKPLDGKRRGPLKRQ
ncbi:MAG: PEGA domain-containing protein [Myxococcaceae bacterium]